MEHGDLTVEDFQTRTWKRLERATQTELDRLREKNDATLPETDTAKLRGRIAVLKEILGLAKASPGQEIGPDSAPVRDESEQ
jgi:hypothetical protein